MNEIVTTVRVMPWSPDQGEYVLIDAADYDPARHTLYQPDEAEAPDTAQQPPAGAPQAPRGRRR